MKKLTVLLTLVMVLAFGCVCDAAPVKDLKLGPANEISCSDGVLKFSVFINNNSNRARTLTSIYINEIRLMTKEGSVLWIGRDRDLGDMAYYLEPGGRKKITVTIRDRNIEGFYGPKKISWHWKVYWEKD